MKIDSNNKLEIILKKVNRLPEVKIKEFFGNSPKVLIAIDKKQVQEIIKSELMSEKPNRKEIGLKYASSNYYIGYASLD